MEGRTYAYIAGGVALIIIMLILMFKPCGIGGRCDVVCTYETTSFDGDPMGGIDSSVCSPGCLIEAIWYDPGEIFGVDHWAVKCKCCDCVLVDEGTLPLCGPPLGWLYYTLGWCQFEN